MSQKVTAAVALAGSLWLSACAQTQTVVDDVARDAAKAAVSEALVTNFPGVPRAAVTPFTNCVIDNASAREIAELAKDAVVGTSGTTVAIVRAILDRPNTQTCLTRAGAILLAG